jgi:glycosyltransferase involved in cell wall biosynthesis
MHFLLIHQSFATPDEPGGTRHFELARGAVERGHEFTVIGSEVSYLTGQSTSATSLSETDSTIEGVRVVRAFTPPTFGGSFTGRLFSFIGFGVSSMIKACRVGKVDVVIGTSPPIFQAVSAWLVSAMRRRPFLLEVRDLWPEFVIDMGLLKNWFLIRASRGLERFLYARADHILVNSPAYVDYLTKKGIEPDKITLLPNGVDPTMFDPSSDGNGVRASLKLDHKFVIVYAGAIGPANDLDLLLAAAEQLEPDSRICFLIVGDGKERKRLQTAANARKLANILFAGAQPKREMRRFLASADACVAVLQNIPMFRMTYPNKVFDYMAAGRPVVLAIDGVIREVVEMAGAGIYIEPGDAKSLADAIRFLACHESEREQMSRNGRSFVEKHFNRSKQSQQFVELLQRLATHG